MSELRHRTVRTTSSLVILACLASFVRPAVSFAGAKEATGRVYHDTNDNRHYDAGEPLLSGMRVSNGHEIVKTDDEGRYRLPIDDDTILFVIKPHGWRTPLGEENLPEFYYIHKPNGSPKTKFAGVEPTGPLPDSVDFPLYPQKEPDHFEAIMFGDTQPRDQKEVDYIAHDVVEELIGTDAAFGVTLGDVAFDNLSTFGPLNRAIALIGIPWYNVIGNHDLNREADDDHLSDETFERVYGPVYYSFEYGTAHFIVLDDVEWIVDSNNGHTYRGGLGEKQIEFVRNDLALIPKDQLVVLFMHIPLVDVRDRHELYRLIEKRPFALSLSAHTHYHEHRFITTEDGWQGAEPHHHVINVTVCGSWWSGQPDERGIPHTTMRDGAPNGYSIFTFDGHDYAMRFKAAGRPADYQMNIIAPEEVSSGAAGETDVYVNVFNGSERSTVEMRLGTSGDWIAMQRDVRIDPLYQAVVDREAKLNDKSWHDLPEPVKSTHLWRARLPESPPAGTHLLQVRTTDMHGTTYHGRRVIRVD